MTNLLVNVFDVEHGTCIYLQTPNGKKAMFDCGSSSEFSPALHLNDTEKKKKLDYLVITHPHQDHITDLENIEEKFNITVLSRNKKITKKIMEDDNPEVFDSPNDVIIGRYFDLSDRFTNDADWGNDPKNPVWGNGCTIHTFNNSDTSLEVNDLSVIVFVQFADEVILYGGDLKEKGWLELLKNQNFVKMLKKTTIFVASHHGNDSGYCSDLFEYFTPKITIVSAGRYREHDATSKYDEVTDGMDVHSKSNGTTQRKVITTRNDGHIQVVISPDSSIPPKITIK